MSEKTFSSPYLHPDSDYVILTHGRMPIITRRHGLRPFFPEGTFSLGTNVGTFRVFFFPSSLLSALLEQEEDGCAFCPRSRRFPDASSWLQTTRVSSWTLSNFLPLLALSHFPLHADFCPLLNHGYCYFFHYFVPGSEVPRPHCLINMTSYFCLQSGVDRWLVISNILLVIHGQHSLKLDRIL